MGDVDGDEMTRRVRAAWAYSGLEQRDFNAKLEKITGTPAATWRGYLLKTRPNAPALDTELEALATVTGVPLWFLEDGWSGWAQQPADDARLRMLWLALGDMAVRLGRLEAADLRQPGGDVLPAERDDTLRRLEGLARSWLAGEQQDRPQEPGTAGGSGQ